MHRISLAAAPEQAGAHLYVGGQLARDRDALWRALIDGTLRIVERRDADVRGLMLVENPHAERRRRALSGQEIALLELTLRGHSGKEAAFALGRTESAVSRGVAAIARKLGLASRLELLRVGAALCHDERTHARVAEALLTPAERQVLALLRSGLSNHAIAAYRQTSVYTVVNQISSLLRKTQLPGRRALMVVPIDSEGGRCYPRGKRGGALATGTTRTH
jgi:DNA-binding NarL/FixJ family response regulator